MDPSSAHQQEMSNETLETILVCSNPSNNRINNLQDHQKKPRPQPEQALKCPRCESTNTKFCYYNNYSLTQPRYLCKSCRRYWTKGGTLRNVPVGGGCRKTKRSSSSLSSSSSSVSYNNPFKNKNFQEDQPLNNPLITGLPSLGCEAVDLNLAFARLQKQSSLSSSQSSSPPGGQLGIKFGSDISTFGNSNNSHGDIFGNSSTTVNGLGLFGTQTGNFNNLCYGFMVGADDHHHQHPHPHHLNSNSNSSSAMLLPSEESIKQEHSINGNNSENPNKVLWGFPWQLNAESRPGGPDINAGRECWNGLASSWHGLLNSPLS